MVLQASQSGQKQDENLLQDKTTFQPFSIVPAMWKFKDKRVKSKEKVSIPDLLISDSHLGSCTILCKGREQNGKNRLFLREPN